MVPAADLAVLTQDPRFRGGALEQTRAFCRGAGELGRRPHLLYLSRPHLGGRDLVAGDVVETAVSSLVPRVEALAQLAAAQRLAPLVRPSRSLWVVAAAAAHGAAAPRSGRRYACWIGTALEAEWASRAAGLPRSRRLALRANAPILRRLERDVLRGATAVYATSPASRAGLAEPAGLVPERVRILPIPVDVVRFAPGAPPAGPNLVFVGRADDPRKNVALLLAAFRAARAEIPDLRLRLVGPPPPPATVLPRGVEVVGEVASAADELRRAALFVLPSLQEGFGIVAAEALASGVPVVTTPSGGPEELVRASSGGVVLDRHDPDELAATLTRLLGDAVTLARMGRAGREYVVREHSPARFRALLADAFAELDAHG